MWRRQRRRAARAAHTASAAAGGRAQGAGWTAGGDYPCKTYWRVGVPLRLHVAARRDRPRHRAAVLRMIIRQLTLWSLAVTH